MALDKIPISQISGNTLTATANSGSSINASNVNFNNTSYIIKTKFIPKLYNKIPELIKNRFWFGSTSEFNEPSIYLNILFVIVEYHPQMTYQ
mgnify:CR=1 FL=1